MLYLSNRYPGSVEVYQYSDREWLAVREFSIATMTLPETLLKLSLDQIVDALEKKFLMECKGVQAEMSSVSRSLVAKLTAKVRSLESEGNLEY